MNRLLRRLVMAAVLFTACGEPSGPQGQFVSGTILSVSTFQPSRDSLAGLVVVNPRVSPFTDPTTVTDEDFCAGVGVVINQHTKLLYLGGHKAQLDAIIPQRRASAEYTGDPVNADQCLEHRVATTLFL